MLLVRADVSTGNSLSVPQLTSPAGMHCPSWDDAFVSSFIMRPCSLGGGLILRRTLSVRLSVRPSRYRCHR